MPFNIHPEAEKAFNKNAFELVALIEESNNREEVDIPQSGSIIEKPSDDWSHLLADKPIIISATQLGIPVDRFEHYNGTAIGFNEEVYPRFEKLAKSLYKIKNISCRVSYEFVYDSIFEWAVQVHKNKKADEDFTTAMEQKISAVTEDLRYSFKILNLEIEKNFNLGNVEFEYLKADVFDKLQEKTPEKDITPLREKFQGRVFASFTVKNVERKRGMELAMEECCKAMNILKLFSITVIEPKHRTYFDIDRRVNVTDEIEIITRTPDTMDNFNLFMEAGGKPYKLTSDGIDSIIVHAANFVKLLTVAEPNELQRLLIVALDRFSEAISNPNIHRRLVDIFTIWESFFLKDNTAKIQDSIIGYGAIFNGVPKSRIQEFASLIMALYDIRSQVIHHANHKDFDITKMSVLQQQTVSMLETLINISERFPTKQELLTAHEQYIQYTPQTT